MADIIHFTPRAELDAEKNLALFIKQCRQDLTVFGTDLPFDNNVWDLGDHIKLPGRNLRVRAVFSSFEAAKMSQSQPAMSPRFLDFAKAYFRYMYGLRPTKIVGQRLAALRLVDASLDDASLDGRVTAINSMILDRACSLAIEHFSKSLAPKVAGQIELLANFLVESELVDMRTKWVKPIRKARENNARVGSDAEAARQNKMPSASAIEAMAHVFVNAQDPAELYIGSTLALLHCAPQRINETVRLQVGCEVDGKSQTGEPQYGLRWPGSKGFDNSVRWILPTMVDVAKQAISKLTQVSAEARSIALWYENNPDKIYLCPDVEHLRSAVHLSADDISMILYGEKDDSKQILSWCRREELNRTDGRYSFADFESCIVSKLPDGFPHVAPGLKYSDALFSIRPHEMNAKRRTWRCLVGYLSSSQIAGRVGAGGGASETVFDKFSLVDDDGSPVTITSHQVRHYLNTLAQSNGASQIDIAMWSGRADTGQNSAYDHTTPGRIYSNIEELVESTGSDLLGGSLATIEPKVIARRDDAGQLITGSIHVTDYGLCTHDYAMSPCDKHLDCLNCNEMVCIKGDRARTENIRRTRDQTKILLMQAEAAENSDTYGASRWVEHQRRTIDRCDKWLAALESTAVSPGAVVRLSAVESASRLQQAQEDAGSQTSLPVRNVKALEAGA